jgi:hypothetical protein
VEKDGSTKSACPNFHQIERKMQKPIDFTGNI